MTRRESEHIQPLVNDAVVSEMEQLKSQLHKQRKAQQASQDEICSISQQMNNLKVGRNEADTQQKLMEQKILEACYQFVDNLQNNMNQQLQSFERKMRSLMEKCMKFEEIIATQSTRIQQLEEELASNQRSSGVAEALRQQIEARAQQNRILAFDKFFRGSSRLDMMDCKNPNGVLLWKITEIRRRRREAVSGKTPSIYSQPFYTSPNGYKMCARLYLNGNGMGQRSHLSLFFVIMRGKYDSLLPWPFQQRVTLILIDQSGRCHMSSTLTHDPSSPSFKRPKSKMNIASGCPLFVSLTTLDEGAYINNDTLFIRMVVDAIELHCPD